MTAANELSAKIRDFVLAKFPLAKSRKIGDSDDLLDSGIVDSLGILDVVAMLESDLHVTIHDDDLVPENFRSIQHIAEFAAKRKSA
jgi:acyl carrier protein